MARTKHRPHKKRNRKKSVVATGEASPSSPAPTPSPGARTSRWQRNTPQFQPTQRKHRRYKPGTKALHEIRHFQKTTKLLILAASFIREVRSITYRLAPPDINRWTAEALVALQEAAEDFLANLFGDAMLCAIHAKRVTNEKGFRVGKPAWGEGTTLVRELHH